MPLNDEYTIIGWVLRGLRLLPSSKERLFNLLGSLVAFAFVGPVILYVTDDLNSILRLIATPLIAIGSLVAVLSGAWIRKKIDQRMPLGKKRNLRTSDQIRHFLKKHSSSPGKFALRSLRLRNVEAYVFPDPGEKDGLLLEVARVNCAAFKGSSFEDTFDEKYRRNGSHFRKNKYSVMLMSLKTNVNRVNGDTPKGGDIKWVGFTHLLPITEGTYNKYLDGKISDVDFNADDVCDLEKEAYAIIVFSLGLDRFTLKKLHKRGVITRLDRLLSRIGIAPHSNTTLQNAESDLRIGLFYHLQTLLRYQKPTIQGTMRLVAQSFNPKIVDVLHEAHFRNLSKRSKDGEDLYELILQI